MLAAISLLFAPLRGPRQLDATGRQLVSDAAVDRLALARLVQRCKETKSWSLVILHDGKTVADLNFGHARPCNLMSATKSVTGIAIGLLLDDGKIPSVETPVASILPEYKGKWKDKVTIEHLMTHTSGMELYDNPKEDLTNRVAAALAAPILTEPGTQFLYNNRAVDLLSGIVRKVSGKPMDEFLNERLFKPLGIADYSWQRDPDGNPHGCAELVLRPRDLAKIGQLMLDEGVWQGRSILSAEFVRRATHRNRIAQPYPDIDAYGWLWWICDPWMTLSQGSLDALRNTYHVPAEVVRRLEPLVDQRWPSNSVMWGEMLAIAGPCPEMFRAAVDGNQIQALVKDAGGPDGYLASGWGGQYLLVLPKARLVAVRTLGDGFFNPKNPDKIEPATMQQYARLEMQDFYRLLRALVHSPSGVSGSLARPTLGRPAALRDTSATTRRGANRVETASR
jgi:CubicO group peptidase (beta-lactamase class C family)